MSFECLVAADSGGGCDGDDNADSQDSCGHHDFWELEESSTGDGALSKLGSGTGMWPLSSVGNCKGQETFSNCGGFLGELAFLSCIDTNGGSSQHPALGAGCPSVLQRLPRATAWGPGNAPEVLRWTLHIADGTFHYCLKGSKMYSTLICFTYQGGETGNQDSLHVSQRSPSLKSAVRLPQHGKIGHQCLFKMRTREPDR